MFGKHCILPSAQDQRVRSEKSRIADTCVCVQPGNSKTFFYPENTFRKKAMSAPGNWDSAEMYFTEYCLRPGLTSLWIRYLNKK